MPQGTKVNIHFPKSVKMRSDMNGLNNGTEKTETTLSSMSSSSGVSAEPLDAAREGAANSGEEPEEEVPRMAEVTSGLPVPLSHPGGIMKGVPHTTIPPVSTPTMDTTTTTTSSQKPNIYFPKTVIQSTMNSLNNRTEMTETTLSLMSSSSETSAEPLDATTEKEAAHLGEESEEEVPRMEEVTSRILARLPVSQPGGIMTGGPHTTISPISTTTMAATTSQKANIHFTKSVKMQSYMNGLNNGTEKTDTTQRLMSSSLEASAEPLDAAQKEAANSGEEPEEEVPSMEEVTSRILARLPVSQPGGIKTGGPHSTISPISITKMTTTTTSPTTSKTTRIAVSSSGTIVYI